MSQAANCPRCDCQLPANAPAGLCPKCLLQAGFESVAPGDSGNAATAASPSGPSFVPPSVETLGRHFPQLEILELLGQGGMGAVYKARQKGLDRLVAVKILPPHLSRDPAFVERFQREARALAKLNHKNIVSVYDFGQTQGLCYLVMEFIDGPNLRRTISAGKLSPTEALAIVPQICEALQFAHDAGVVHRDIKPENILIDAKGQVKIADFGLAKLLGDDRPDANLTATQQVMGTLRYMAPEQLQGTKAVDHRADIYSLGVVFYELLTGEVPVGRFAPPSQKVQVDVRLDEVVLRTLEQEPAKRYQRAADVRTDVESYASRPAVTLAVPPREAAIEPQLFACAIIAVVALGLGLIVPAVLLAIPFVPFPLPVLLFFGLMLSAIVFGIASRMYALGRYSAYTSGAIMGLGILGISFIWSVSIEGDRPAASVSSDPASVASGRVVSTTPSSTTGREEALLGEWTESNDPALKPWHTLKFLANGEWHESGPLRLAVGDGPKITVSEDLNGDGKKEILPYHASGSWSIDGDELILETSRNNLPDSTLSSRRLRIVELTSKKLVLDLAKEESEPERWIFFRTQPQLVEVDPPIGPVPRKIPSAPTNLPPTRLPTVGELQGAWDSALALSAGDARDQALIDVFYKASLGTQTLDPDFVRELAKDAVTEIRNRERLDQALAAAALNLAKRRHSATAGEIARKIEGVALRDTTLKEVTAITTGVAEAPPGAYVPSPTDTPTLDAPNFLAWRIGTWNYTKTMIKPYPGRQAGEVLTSEASCRWILDKKFVRCDILQSDGVFYTAIEGYDPKEDVYTTWVFSPKGPVVESRKRWDPATRTLAPIPSEQKPSDPTVTTKFISEAKTEGVFITRNTAGEVTSEATTVGTRTSREPSEIIFPNAQIATHPSPFNEVLGREVGEWDEVCVMHRSQTHDGEFRGYPRLSRKWVLGGRFVQTEMVSEVGDYSSWGLVTYDPAIGKMRAWHFDSQGVHSSGEGVYDAEQETVTYADPDGLSKGVVHYDSPDRLHFSVINRTPEGELVLHIENVNARVGSVEAKRLVFDRFVGDWTIRGPKGEMPAQGRWILDDKFLLLRILPPGNDVYFLFGYDPQKQEYRQWQWESDGASHFSQGAGTWDEKARILKFDFSNHHAAPNTTWSFEPQLDGRVIIKTQQGQSPVVTMVAARMPEGEGIPPTPAPVGPQGEMAAMTPFHGNWEATTQDRLTPEAKLEESGMGRHRWALGGYFLEDESRAPDGKLKLWGLWTYDESAKKYREWYFFANGGWQEESGVWNEETKTLDLRGTTSWGDSFIATRKSISPDHYEWTTVGKSTTGEVKLDMTGRMTRK